MPPKVLMVAVTNRKGQNNSRITFGACLRAKVILDCPVFAMGILLFNRLSYLAEELQSDDQRWAEQLIFAEGMCASITAS